eukprot:TRINITY_DN2448_c0_g1_i2.p1 TRINITY_DN2448_c0_g1~~TRINITY_DN2448_c0_g1_i2.p1  ORF type:complete len:236 (-),score=51.77 TRINITY_DN2448_c0_g1_i2:522-1229(-)
MHSYYIRNLNIQGKGGVAAAPDTATPGGSYYYHWERDGALSMRAYMILTGELKEYRTYMEAYTSWVIRVQNLNDPHDQDVRTEPKYYLPEGGVYIGGCCRPQTDGPGLRAIALIQFANDLLTSGDLVYVKENLYTGDTNIKKGGAIYNDLDWVVNNWDQNGCDLWEEIQSNDFFWNRYNFRKALLDGAAFAKRMGDSSLANKYQTQAQKYKICYMTHIGMVSFCMKKPLGKKMLL